MGPRITALHLLRIEFETPMWRIFPWASNFASVPTASSTTPARRSSPERPFQQADKFIKVDGLGLEPLQTRFRFPSNRSGLQVVEIFPDLSAPGCP